MAGEALSVERLKSWVLAGAHWRVAELSERVAWVDLCACTGEPVQRLRTEDAAVIEYLREERCDSERC